MPNPATAAAAAAAAPSSSSKKSAGDPPESAGAGAGSVQKAQRSKPARPSDDADKKLLFSEEQTKRLKDVEISFPIVYGTISFWLGKKASEYNSHKWTVYVRGATNEDLSVIVKRAVFQLHPSFNNPTRVVESAPFEVSESGWGEFEIAISLFFHSDVCDKQLDLYHQLKLYPEDDSAPQSTKSLLVQNHPAAVVPRLPPGLSLPPQHVNEKKRGDTKDHALSQWFMNFSEADELLKLAAARQQVQAHIVKLRRQLTKIDGPPQQSRAASGQ
uniref:YEATS domain-containing protein n=1 Tax=Ananas comosus var. bracteatus TaxID=296719 RepID=A0A6V7NPU8_ANACO|nr:unnamed protein product [Ananas comosus var. bracteatus]